MIRTVATLPDNESKIMPRLIERCGYFEVLGKPIIVMASPVQVVLRRLHKESYVAPVFPWDENGVWIPAWHLRKAREK